MLRDKNGTRVPTAEELVDEAWASHVSVLHRIQYAGESSIDTGARYSSVPTDALEVLDHLGVDRILICKFKKGYFWLPIQIKTADFRETVGVMFSSRTRFYKKFCRKLSDSMLAIFKEHIRKHPDVECVLFVDIPCKLSFTKRKKALKAIWRETLKLVRLKIRTLSP